MPAGTSEPQRQALTEALDFMNDHLEFLGGSFINQFSHQRFGGGSAEVARCLTLLRAVGIWEVRVRFRQFGEQQTAFTLDQNTSDNHLRMIVNSGRDDFLLKDFAPYLPPPGNAGEERPHPSEKGGGSAEATHPADEPPPADGGGQQ